MNVSAEKREQIEAAKKKAIESGGLSPEAAEMVEPLIMQIHRFAEAAGAAPTVLLLEEGVERYRMIAVLEAIVGKTMSGKGAN